MTRREFWTSVRSGRRIHRHRISVIVKTCIIRHECRWFF